MANFPVIPRLASAEYTIYRPPSRRVSAATRLKQYALLGSLFFLPIEPRVRALYAMDSTYNLFAEKTLFRNLGYWKDGPKTLDDACRAMASLLGDAAAFQPYDQILDVGCGFADQDIFWIDHFAPRLIVGLDIIPAHIALGKQRVAERQLGGRVELCRGSATNLPFPAERFNKVVALESAFQFATRETFFREAYRVLQPGGRLATAEPIPLPGQKQSRVAEYFQRSVVAIPKANLYSRETYTMKMEQAGFRQVQVVSIREHVYAPFMHYLRRRIHDADILERMNPLVRGMWQGWIAAANGDAGARSAENQDYILAVGEKPMS